MPLFHLHGIMVNVLVTFAAGGSVVCTTGWSDAATFFSMAAAKRATWYSAVPSIHLAVLVHAEKVLHRTGIGPPHSFKLARNCSAALSPSIASRLEVALGCTVLPTYAMSECVPICSNPRSGIRKLGSVGPPAGPEVAILGPDSELTS